MINKKGQANPAHTTNLVPLIILGLDGDEARTVRSQVTISDIAPTMLKLRGLPKADAWDCDSVLTVLGRKGA